MKNRKLILTILIVVLVLFYNFICFDLVQQEKTNLMPTKMLMVRRLSYSVIGGVLLTGISHFLHEKRRVLKKILKFAGLWCVTIASLMILLVLSGVVQL